MAIGLTLPQLEKSISDPVFVRENGFAILRALASSFATEETSQRSRDLVIRLLEQRDALGKLSPILDAVVSQVGLFPYIASTEQLDTRDVLSYERHRPTNLEKRNVVFHRGQAEVYWELLDGQSVILSAPTSFGKSLIIDAVIASEKFKNIAIVVPTIALIDETRRRLSAYRKYYKIITHPQQSKGQRNVFILTQERVFDRDDLKDIEFFVIDEFYKLDPGRESDDTRAAVLNAAFYTLAKQAKQFYMLGPNIRGVPVGFPEKFKCTFIATGDSTVVSESHFVDVSQGREAALIKLCRSLQEPTLIYCRSPASAKQVATILIENVPTVKGSETRSAANWVQQNVHPTWSFAQALLHGVGIHHGRIPRSLAQYVVRAFNKGHLKFLICTSTLIEGVNTAAKNVVLYDNELARAKLDYFTFNNIRGRSGRMFQHFVGRVFLFGLPPQQHLQLIDIPLFTQGENTATSLLMQMDREDLTQRSEQRLERFFRQDVLDVNTLRQNKFVDPASQLELAGEILGKLNDYHKKLSWSGFPKYEELQCVCELIFDYLAPRSGTVRSGAQLAYRLSRLYKTQQIREIVEDEIARDTRHTPPDDIVENVLDFIRTWATFHFPRLLLAVDRIQKSLFAKRGLSSGNYAAYAGQVENLFLPSTMMALDEFGIPLQLALKLNLRLKLPDNLDACLDILRDLNPSDDVFHPFERELLTDVIRTI